jgi:hypothetical protein
MALPLTQRVRRLRVRRCAQAVLGALDALLEHKLLGIGELLRSRFGLTEELEGAVVLLVVEVIQPVPEEVSGSARGGHPEQRRRVGRRPCYRCRRGGPGARSAARRG